MFIVRHATVSTKASGGPSGPEWVHDCLQWRGALLEGKYKHWCMDWDGLPIDETCVEFTCCVCFDESDEVVALKAVLRAGLEL